MRYPKQAAYLDALHQYSLALQGTTQHPEAEFKALCQAADALLSWYASITRTLIRMGLVDTTESELDRMLQLSYTKVDVQHQLLQDALAINRPLRTLSRMEFTRYWEVYHPGAKLVFEADKEGSPVVRVLAVNDQQTPYYRLGLRTAFREADDGRSQTHYHVDDLLLYQERVYLVTDRIERGHRVYYFCEEVTDLL